MNAGFVLRAAFFLALSLLCLSKAPLAAAGPKCEDSLDGPAPVSRDRVLVCGMVNADRAALGERAVVLDPRLSEAAQLFAQDMAARDYFSHVSPEGHDLDWRLRNIPYPGLAGENIAWGYAAPDKVMEGWMFSSGHRENILNPRFKKIGVGYSHEYWVQIFTD